MKTSKNKILTIIIPILTVDDELKKTLDSVSKHPEIICLIVKPASVVFELEKNDVEISVVDESSAGIYNAFNDGLSSVTTEFVMFCGSGDVLNIHNILRNIGRYSNGDIIEGAVESDFQKRKNVGFKTSNPVNLDKLFSSHSVGLVFNTNFHRQIGNYDLSFARCSDYDLFIRALATPSRFYSTTEVFGVWPNNGFSSKISGFFKAIEHFNIRRKNRLKFRHFYFLLNVFEFTVIQGAKNVVKAYLFR